MFCSSAQIYKAHSPGNDLMHSVYGSQKKEGNSHIKKSRIAQH